MSSQIFKSPYPKKLLFDFLDIYAEKKNNYYYFTKISFKKALFDKAIKPYCDSLKQYYFNSKHKSINILFFRIFLIPSLNND